MPVSMLEFKINIFITTEADSSLRFKWLLLLNRKQQRVEPPPSSSALYSGVM